MVRIFTLSLFFALAASSAAAQSEVEKRRMHVPYVRAATDCVAAVVSRDAEFDMAVAADNLKPSIGRALASCRQSLVQMINAHDTIYGAGGQAFFAGAYLDDVDRAVRVRLAAQIAASRGNAERIASERQAAELRAQAQRLEAETKAKAAQAERMELLSKTRDLISAKALACIGREGATMLLTDEKAEVVAKAAMIFCQADIDALVRATIEIVETESGAQSNRANVRSMAESRVREVVTAHIIRSRGNLIGKSLKESQGAPAAAAPPRISPTL